MLVAGLEGTKKCNLCSAECNPLFPPLLTSLASLSACSTFRSCKSVLLHLIPAPPLCHSRHPSSTSFLQVLPAPPYSCKTLLFQLVSVPAVSYKISTVLSHFYKASPASPHSYRPSCSFSLLQNLPAPPHSCKPFQLQDYPAPPTSSYLFFFMNFLNQDMRQLTLSVSA